MDKQVQNAWQEFRDSGLLWYTNMNLHVFGWAIVVNVNDDKKITKVYPQRVKYRGFSEESNTKGYEKVTRFLNQEYTKLKISFIYDKRSLDMDKDSCKYWDQFIKLGLFDWLNLFILTFGWKFTFIKKGDNTSNVYPIRTGFRSLDNGFIEDIYFNVNNYIRENSGQLLEAFIENNPKSIETNKSTVVCRSCCLQPIKSVMSTTKKCWDLCNKCIIKYIKKEPTANWPIRIMVPNTNKFLLLSKILKVNESNPKCWVCNNDSFCDNNAFVEVFYNNGGDNCEQVLCENHLLDLLEKMNK